MCGRTGAYVQAHCSRYVRLCAAIPVPMCTYVRCMVSMISRLARTVRMCRGGGVCACAGGHYVQHPALNSDRVCACMCAQLFACAVCVFVCQPLVGNTTQQSTAGPAHTPAHTPPQITAHTPKKPTCTYPLVSRESGGIETSAWYIPHACPTHRACEIEFSNAGWVSRPRRTLNNPIPSTRRP